MVVVVGGGGGGSDVKVGCTIYWKFFSPVHISRGMYSPFVLMNHYVIEYVIYVSINKFFINK